MAEIKSALEIALARTEGIETDRSKIEAKQLKIDGRKAALAFLESKTELKELAAAVKKHKGDKLNAFKAGAAETFMSYLKLPSDDSYKEGFEKAGQGLGVIAPDAGSIQQMFEQLSQFFDQYIQNKDQMESQLTAQFEPLLKQKEEALYAQTGSRIHIDPLDDPEFQKVYNQNMGNLAKSYSEALGNAREQLKEFLGLAD